MKTTALALLALVATGCAYSDPNPNAPSPNVTTGIPVATAVSVTPPPQPPPVVVVTSPPPDLVPQPSPSVTVTVSVASLADLFDPHAFESCVLPDGSALARCVPLAAPVRVYASTWTPADRYDFDFGDGATLTTSSAQADHKYSQPNGYRVTVTAHAGAVVGSSSVAVTVR